MYPALVTYGVLRVGKRSVGEIIKFPEKGSICVLSKEVHPASGQLYKVTVSYLYSKSKDVNWKLIALLGSIVQVQCMSFSYKFSGPSEIVPDVPEILAMPLVQQVPLSEEQFSLATIAMYSPGMHPTLERVKHINPIIVIQ
jgi:hypothetical protein